ncbi:hypothetical protein ACFS07_10925 [Undibacterium arcticum]
MTATLAENIIGDNTQTYVLDYEALAATTKVTNMDIGVTDTGLLTGINSAVVDQTGNVIKDTATSVASIARAIVFAVLDSRHGPIRFPWHTASASKTNEKNRNYLRLKICVKHSIL